MLMMVMSVQNLLIMNGQCDILFKLENVLAVLFYCGSTVDLPFLSKTVRSDAAALNKTSDIFYCAPLRNTINYIMNES